MPVNAGSAFVTILPDMSKFGAAAQAETASAGKAFGLSFNQALTVGLGLATAAIVKFGADAVASAREHEEAVAQLRVAVDGATEGLENQATALQNLTGFQDEEIIKAQTVLARFKLTDQQLQQLIPTVLDYARATGKDATSAAEAVGKALLGNTRALKAVGISYTSTGDTAQDFTNIIGLLDEKVGGAAEAFATTYSGKIEILAAKFDDLKEAVGQRLLGPLTEVVEALDALLGGNTLDITNLDQFNAAMRELPEDIAFQFIARSEDVSEVLVVQQRNAMLAAEQQAALADATGLATTAAEEQAKAVKASAAQFPGLIGAVLDLKEAQKELKEAQNDASTSAADLRDKELAVVNAYLGVKGAFADVVEEYKTGGATMKDVINQFRDQAAEAGLSKGQIADLVAVVRRYIRSLRDIPDTVTTTVRTNYSHQQLAEGGVVTRPTVALIGEAGPEAVVPLNKASMMLDGSGGGWGSGDIVIQIDGREVFRAVRSEALRNGRNNGTTGL